MTLVMGQRSLLTTRKISPRNGQPGTKTLEKKSRLRSTAGLTTDEVTAKTLESKLDSFERLDRMMASAEARRNNALREIDRHREALGGAVRQAIDEVQDAEFQDVETGAAGGRTPP